MKRKIVLHGPSTLTVSLPSSWVKKFNIKKGDELNLEERDKELRIFIEKDISLGKKDLKIWNSKKIGKTNIISAYRRGYDEIHVNGEGNFLRDVDEIASREITGFEIVKHDKDFCILKDLAGHSKNEFDTALRRIWLLVLDLSNESLEAIKENNLPRLNNIKTIDQSINKFSNYCLRILTKKGHSDFTMTQLYYHFIKSLEMIADRYKDLCNLYSKNPEKIDKNFLLAFRRLNDHLQEFYGLFYKYEEQKAELLFQKIKETYTKISQADDRRGIYLSSLCKDVNDLLEVLAEINL